MHRLQWGRGAEAAEGRGLIEAAYARGGFNGAAALRPRKGTYSRDEPGHLTGFNGAAALRPRKGPSGHSYHRATHLLQWGRGAEAAEG